MSRKKEGHGLAETYSSPGLSDWDEVISPSRSHFNLSDVAGPTYVFDEDVHPVGAASDYETHAACVRAWHAAERTPRRAGGTREQTDKQIWAVTWRAS